MGVIIWSHWIWEIGLLFIIIGCIYVNSDDANDRFTEFWDALQPFIATTSILGLILSYSCFFICITDEAENYNDKKAVERILTKYGSWAEMHKYCKNCWWNGTKILLAVLVVAAFIGGIILIKGLKKKKLQKKLKEIDIAIKKVNEQKLRILKPNQYEQSKEYEELDRMEDVLTKAKSNIERQAAMAEVSRGIHAIKDIQRDYEFIDVQSEIDEIDALNELGW